MIEQTLTDQEPARRLLLRALELLGPRGLGLGLLERLAHDDPDGSCGAGIAHLHALLEQLDGV